MHVGEHLTTLFHNCQASLFTSTTAASSSSCHQLSFYPSAA
uniref:Uncharacterized protein n=1 Tax=Zea mays TaxID=4577 RepID=C4J1M0_MAIZE|nr:unknown [Zea mays]